VGIKGTVYRPESYEQNFKEIDCYSANEVALAKIAELLTDKEDGRKRIIAVGGKIRELATIISKVYSPSVENQAKIVELAKMIRPDNPYQSITAATLTEAMDGFIEQCIPVKTLPLHPNDIFSVMDPFTSWMSTFGSNIPSLEIPMAPRWKVDSAKIPVKFVGQFAVRLCSMDIARGEWMNIRNEKVIHNAPERISAILNIRQSKGRKIVKMFGRSCLSG